LKKKSQDYMSAKTILTNQKLLKTQLMMS